MPTEKGDNHISSNDDVYQQAASWVAQLDSGRLSDADRIALAEWISRSPRHASEIHRLAALWGHLDTLLDSAIEANTVEAKTSLPSFIQLFRLWLAYRPASLIVASIVFALLAANLSGFMTSPSSENTGSFETAVGEFQKLTLPDGSIASLNTNSKIEFTYSNDIRRITLSKGEALFEVAKDTERPFQVYAGNTYVEALGTAFLVRRYKNKIDVTVTEGVVQVKPSLPEQTDSLVTPASSSKNTAQDIKQQPAVLSAGQSLRVSNDQSTINDIEPATIEKKTAWQDGLLIFDGDSLEYVLNEVARYTSAEIIISDEDLRSLEMSGVFKTNNLPALLNTLEQSLDIEVTFDSERFIYINKKI